MSKKRDKTTAEIIRLLSMFSGKTPSVEQTEEELKALTDEEFEDYIRKLGTGEEILPYSQPPLVRPKVSLKRNMEIAKKLGHNFYERYWITSAKTGLTTLSERKNLCCHQPLRRQAQHLMKKIAIGDSNGRIDELTGQVVGKGIKASALSPAELLVVWSHGLKDSIREYTKFRGGDIEGYRRLTKAALATGTISMDMVDDGRTRVRSTITLNTYLKAAMLGGEL